MKIKKSFNTITKHYKKLIKLTKKHYFVGISNEWLVDNYFLIVEQNKIITDTLKDKVLRKYFHKNIDLCDLISDILSRYNYHVTEDVIVYEVNAFQKENKYNLNYEEISLIPIAVSAVLFEKLSEICVSEGSLIEDKAEVLEMIESLKDFALRGEKIELEKYFPITVDTDKMKIVYFNEQLKELGVYSNDVFRQLNEALEREELSLNHIINNVHLESTNSNITVGNIFRSLDKLRVENLFNRISNVEKALKRDKYYFNSTLITKGQYRAQVVKLSKKLKINPVELVENLLIESDDISSSLFREQQEKGKAYCYLFLVYFFTVIVTLWLAGMFIPNILIGFIVLAIPVNQIVITLLNKIYLSFVKSKPLLKLDFSEGIPEDYQTMVVIPTILKDKEKVNAVFDSLESYYLSNKSDNLYFSLLGDCKENGTEVYEKDDEVSQAGCDRAHALNKKYGKEIFNFAYRRRFYNEGEGSWLGYERKRGALLHFNELILGNFTEEEKKKWFNAHTFGSFKANIKYVITLDVDTQLILNNAQKLIGTMAHPINRPFLNEEENCVIKGHALMQPKIVTDVDSTNKSLFSQLYNGIGGFDPYSFVSQSFYQDVFDEGSFIGKGIYDLKVYQHVLKNAFPENLILSHDLVEGNFLRVANVLDVEFIDDFPSKFLVDATRRARWARGDMQVVDWATPKVRNAAGEFVKNPTTSLGRFKIVDNITRGLVEASLLLIVICALAASDNPVWWILFAILVLALPVISSIIDELNRPIDPKAPIKYYSPIIFGYKAFSLRTLSVFSSLPFNAKLYITSFSKSLYRMFVSKKRLLNWITAEDAEKTTKSDVPSTVKQFWFNYAVIAIIMIFALTSMQNIVLSVFVSLIFAYGPFFAYIISKDPGIETSKDVKENDKEYVRDIAIKTWKFFEDNMTAENNYLIPDNYQVNRDIKADVKSSPTNIGMSLISVVSARELDIIDDEKALFFISKIITSAEKLPKYEGHLYNWFNIHTLEVMFPHFISSVDSGNFVASLIVVKEYLKKIGKTELEARVQKLINGANFKFLFDEDDDVLSVGYNVLEGRMEPYNYNKFVSESRITSFVAIAKGDLPSRHWFALDKTLGVFNGRKGIVSWSGTAFEYYMPLLFMRSYPNTLLDESYHFALEGQKKFIKEVGDYPWGISESAYNELDDAQNYKYKAFGVPYLMLRQEPSDRVVISPYGSLIAITEFPREVINNIRDYEKLDMFGEYGLYDAYDIKDDKAVLTFYAHHQGMILGSIANFLRQGAIQKYFINDINNKAFNVLTKEKTQLKPAIDLKVTKYKKYIYQKEVHVNDIRVFNYISTLPEVSILSNSKYTMFINDRGNGFSRYRTTQLNRYRKITEQDYGMFLYIKDLSNNKIWSNTYSPLNKNPDKYEVVFALDRVKFVRTDEDIITTTEIVVTRTHNAEIRKVTFKNNSDKPRILELTTYTEPILCENITDISHPAFANLFVHSEYEKDVNSIIVHRKLRENNGFHYMINRLLIDNPLGDYEYETSRSLFVGLDKDSKNPIALNQKLSNHVGTNVDSIISLRNKIKIEANDEKTVYIINGFGRSKDHVLEIANTFSDERKIEEGAFDVATIMNIVSNKRISVTGNDIRLYNTMLNYLYQTNHLLITEERRELQRRNALNQSGLWKFGLSGDLPVVLLEINNLNNLSLIKQTLRAFEYYKSKSICIDLVIINDAITDKDVILREIEEERYRMNALNGFHKIPGNIYVLEKEEVDENEINLLRMVSRLKIDASLHPSLQDYIVELEALNTVSRKDKYTKVLSAPVPYDANKLVYENGFGGFINNGKDYLITNQKTPTVWSNVIANEKFGTVVTNSGGGFTFKTNSREFKITSWNNDTVVDDLSEGIKINDISLKYDQVKVGFGYSEFKGILNNLEISLTHFVSATDPIKFYKMRIKNNGNSKETINLKYWLNPCLGTTEEKTGRHILCDYHKEKNYLMMRNVYSQTFGHENVFMSSTLPIDIVQVERIISKSIESTIEIDASSEKEMSFMLGSTMGQYLEELLSKYSTIDSINQELDNVIKSWDDKLTKIQVNTPSKSFNYMINGWLLYQSMSSRLYAKAGYHQVGGAFGYRDQLQDSMNICAVHPEITRKQILWNAQHQFHEGDVLHWWHEELHFGLRSHYKDDYLWLVYATHEYITITGDISILNEQVPFAVGEPLREGEHEKGISYSYSGDTATLYEHCRLAMERSFNDLGENGLPLMGGGDWNDGMNMIGYKGKGTSVWLGLFLYFLIDKFVEITNKFDSSIDTTGYNVFGSILKQSIKDIAWDGEYYLRAFFDNGSKVGAKGNKECEIDLLSQSWAILTDIATPEQIPSILKNVEEKLVDKKTKIIKLLTPAFESSENNPGYIMDYPVGIRENGGQYTHATSWYIQALLKLGKFDEAFERYQMVNPICRTLDEKQISQYRAEPYVVAADIYSNPALLGQGGWTWYTGSSAWFYRVGILDIIGFNKRGDKLYINPKIPSDWNEFSMTYKYEDTTYNISVIRGKTASITVDDEKVEYIQLVNDSKEHKVIVHI